ncbi:ankyrin repeat-containing domain protein [Aspergillus cavernicola]|uniref:Ankyrin repeat-containing domain protein n=1 Tax=Aspergillus cavernicola TaxID=176166 RepID=A0ABR4IUV6_9EURO
MPLNDLPSELLYNVWLHLDSIQDMNSFVQISRQTHSDFNPYLYRYAAQHYPAPIAHWAGRHGHENLLRWLITERPDILSNKATTPLFPAAKHSQEAVLRLLINNNVDLEMRNTEAKTALHIAAEQGHETVARLLHRAGANLDRVNGSSETALIAAARNGHDNVVLFLLDEGASATFLDDIECLALGHAVEKCSFAVIERLLPLTPKELLDIVDEFQRTPLTTAAELGNVPAGKLLLAAGASLHAGGRGSTALRVAIQHQQTEMARFLLQAGAQVNDSPEQYPPLLLAAQLGLDEIVRLLLEQGADPDYVLPWGRSTVDCAAWEGHYGIVKQLLDAGASPDPDGDRLRCPLIGALSEGHDDTAALLIERGAEMNWEYDSRWLTTLLWAVRNGNEDLTRKCIEDDHDIEAGEEDGRTALVIAAQNHRKGCMDLLLGAGASVEARDGRGRTPLAIAAERGWADMVVTLLDHEAIVASTPSPLVSEEQGKASPPVIDTPDNLNRTPLFFATVNGHTDIVAALLARGSTAIDHPTCANRTPRSIVAQWLHSKDLPKQYPASVISNLFEDPRHATGTTMTAPSTQEQESESLILEPSQAFSDQPWDLYHTEGISCRRCSTPMKQYVERFACDICYRHSYNVCPECVANIGTGAKCMVASHELRRVDGE